MSARMKALVWEECRTGGVIAGWCFLFLSIPGFISIKFGYLGPPDWVNIGDICNSITIGAPLFVALLLPLTTANSGHLKGGFPSRILLLPVDAWEAVSTALGMRMLFTGAMSLGTLLLSYLLFDNGPGFTIVFLVMNIYLLLQTFDWVRRPAPITMTVLITAGVCFGVYSLLNIEQGAAVLSSLGDLSVSPWTFIVLAPVSFGVSWLSAAASRQGMEWSGGIHWRIPKVITIPAFQTTKPFASAESAQFWYEMRTTGLFIPWLWLATWVFTSIAALLLANIKVGRGATIISTPQLYVWLELAPCMAMVLAMAIWGGCYGTLRTWRKAKNTLFLTLPPAATVILARARLKSALTCFSLTLLAASAISISFALWGGTNGTIWSLMLDSMAHKESSIQEWTLFLLWPMALTAIVSWGLSAFASKRMFLYLCLLIGMPVLLFVVGGLLSSYFVHEEEVLIILFGFLMFIAYPCICVGMTVSAYITAWRWNLMPGRDLFIAAGVWMLISLAVFPVSWDILSPWAIGSLGYRETIRLEIAARAGLFVAGGIIALMTAGWMIMPYAIWTLNFSRLRHGENTNLKIASPPMNPWTWKKRLGLCSAACAMLLAIAMFRLPMAPDYKAYWQGQGIPISAKEAISYIGPRQWGDNGANVYIELGKKWDLNNRFMAIYDDWVPPGTPPPGFICYEDPSRALWLQLHYLSTMLNDSFSYHRGQRLSQTSWDCVLYAWRGEMNLEKIGQYGRRLIAGMDRFQYPVRFGAASNESRNISYSLTGVANMLKLDALIACVENRPRDAVEDIQEILRLAYSLKNAPAKPYQDARIRILSISADTLEDVFSRVTLDPTDMELLQNAFSAAFPWDERGKLMERPVLWAMADTMLNTRMIIAHLEQHFVFDYTSAPILRAAELMKWQSVLERIRNNDLASLALAVKTLNKEKRYIENQYALPTNLSWRLPTFKNMTGDLYSDHDNVSEHAAGADMDLAMTALAVERFRLANGRIPETLDELVPAYLERIPGDAFSGGAPIKYRVGALTPPVEPKADADDSARSRHKNQYNYYERMNETPLEYVIYSVGFSAVYESAPGGYSNISFAGTPPSYRETPDIAPDDSVEGVFGGKSMREDLMAEWKKQAALRN